MDVGENILVPIFLFMIKTFPINATLALNILHVLDASNKKEVAFKKRNVMDVLDIISWDYVMNVYKMVEFNVKDKKVANKMLYSVTNVQELHYLGFIVKNALINVTNALKRS